MRKARSAIFVIANDARWRPAAACGRGFWHALAVRAIFISSRRRARGSSCRSARAIHRACFVRRRSAPTPHSNAFGCGRNISSAIRPLQPDSRRCTMAFTSTIPAIRKRHVASFGRSSVPSPAQKITNCSTMPRTQRARLHQLCAHLVAESKIAAHLLQHRPHGRLARPTRPSNPTSHTHQGHPPLPVLIPVL